MRLVNMTLFPKENVLMVHCVTYYTVYYARIMALTMLPRMESKKKNNDMFNVSLYNN